MDFPTPDKISYSSQTLEAFFVLPRVAKAHPAAPAATDATTDTIVPRESNNSCTQCQHEAQNFQTSDFGQPLHDWPELAVNIDIQAFPAFTDLNVKSLLYYQAELTMLKKKLQQMECE